MMLKTENIAEIDMFVESHFKERQKIIYTFLKLM